MVIFPPNYVEELEQYKDRISILKKEDIDVSKLDQNYGEMASCLFVKLCEIKPNLRYQWSNILTHPWITKDENGIVPLNFHQQIEKTDKMFDKFKNIQNFLLSIAILRGKYTELNASPDFDEYKNQITQEEYLDFTPTPKKIQPLESFGDQLNSDSDETKKNQEIIKIIKKMRKGNLRKVKNGSKLFLNPGLLLKTKVFE